MIEKDLTKEYRPGQPYEIHCSCGADTEYNAKFNADLDLILTVYPCEKCQADYWADQDPRLDGENA